VREEIDAYFKRNYDKNIMVKDFENENLGFDVVASYKNLNLLIEYKSRFFISGRNEMYLKQYDILIELIQSLPSLQKIPGQVNNGNINRLFNSHKTNTAIGWFYKCIADRLVFFRFLDDSLYDVIDLDFKYFKQWLMNKISEFELQYSDKTTGTINLKIPLKNIPKVFLRYSQPST